MAEKYGDVNALLMSGGGIRSYGWDINSFINKNRIESALFIPYPVVVGEDCSSYDEHFEDWKEYLSGTSIKEFNSIHNYASDIKKFSKDYFDAINSHDALIVTGGNTFKALNELQERSLMKIISEKVLEGSLSYMGISAGSGIACQTIQGTNDDPIVHPKEGFGGLGIVPFNIKPHYFEPKPGQGESQQVRIGRYLSANDNPYKIVGLPERTSLIVEGGKVTYCGSQRECDAWVFSKGVDPKKFTRGDDLSFLLE